MPRIEVQTAIRAPLPVVFDLARSIDAHVVSQARSNERAVAGRQKGLIELGEEVTWEAVHLGVRQRLTTKITHMDRPRHFRDSMVAGAFRRFDHDHFFSVGGPGMTQMRDVFDYTSPLPPLGWLADLLFLRRYMTSLLEARNRVIKELAESGEYSRFLS